MFSDVPWANMSTKKLKMLMIGQWFWTLKWNSSYYLLKIALCQCYTDSYLPAIIEQDF